MASLIITELSRPRPLPLARSQGEGSPSRWSRERAPHACRRLSIHSERANAFVRNPSDGVTRLLFSLEHRLTTTPQSYAGICSVYFPRNRDPLCDRAGTTGSTVRVSTRARNCSPQPWRDLSEPSSSVRWVSYSSPRASSSSAKRAPSSPPARETCTPERANREPFLWRSSGRSDTRSAPPRETAAAGVFVPAAAVVPTRYP